MQVTKEKFDMVMHWVKYGSTTPTIALKCKVSERQVQRIREAGTWDKWPYILAKTTHGYMTPEYKAYLKRRGLPLRYTKKVPKGRWVPKESNVEPVKRSLFTKLFGWLR